MKTWIVVGEDRQVGAIGVWTGFRVEVQADNAEAAREQARQLRYQAGREHVHTKRAWPSDEPERYS